MSNESMRFIHSYILAYYVTCDLFMTILKFNINEITINLFPLTNNILTRLFLFYLTIYIAR